jgi:TPR repeat protein
LAAKTEAVAAQGRNALAERMPPEQILASYKRAKELRAQAEARQHDKELLVLKGKAEEGDAEAQSRLGTCYAFGQGVATNYVEALKWWRKAAVQNDALAQCSLGICYYLGQGLDKNYAEAVKWYRKAAEQNNPEAQYSLGVCYGEGQGVAKDNAEAIKWYRRAAGQNHTRAQYNLGVSYHLGQGVPKDDVEAYAWSNLAARTASGAAANCDDLEKSMSPQQVAAAKKRAKEWQAMMEAKLKNNAK